MLVHPGIEVRLVDAMTLLDLFGARELLVFPDAVRHDDAPLEFLVRRSGMVLTTSPKGAIAPRGTSRFPDVHRTYGSMLRIAPE
jgi:hypothetical protein